MYLILQVWHISQCLLTLGPPFSSTGTGGLGGGELLLVPKQQKNELKKPRLRGFFTATVPARNNAHYNLTTSLCIYICTYTYRDIVAHDAKETTRMHCQCAYAVATVIAYNTGRVNTEAWPKWLPFCRWHFQMHFLERKLWYILIPILMEFVLQGPIDQKSALVQVMACCLPGNKPLPEPMMT